MKKLSKYIEFATTLLKQAVQERRFRYSNTTLKYMYQPCKGSNRLLVVFSACTRPGIPARYNYMRTLKDVPVNRLFILDDFGEDHRGGYYLGAYPDFEMEKAAKALIDSFLKRPEIKKICFGGSSKGGWAALNFGVQYAGRGLGAETITGAPQFWLGTYLHAPGGLVTLHSIASSTDDVVVQKPRMCSIRISRSTSRQIVQRTSSRCTSTTPRRNTRIRTTSRIFLKYFILKGTSSSRTCDPIVIMAM